MKKSSSVNFTKARINVEDMTITEVTKDGEFTFDLKDELAAWDGVEGISLTIKKNEEYTD